MLLFAAAPAPAQDEPIARIELTPETVAVGEAAELRVTVLVPTWFPTPPQFPSFEVPNAVVRLPPNSSRATSERVGRASWSGITRRYEVYPLISANFLLGGERMRLSYANPGADPIEAEIELDSVSLQVTVPAGAQSLDPYVAGTRFELRRDIEPEPTALSAGDALVVTYTAELEGLPAIFLPPLAPQIDSSAVSVYADEPVVSEGPPATRTEKTTLVLNSGGDFVLPAVSLRWWNTVTSTIETAAVEPSTISVTGLAVMEPDQTFDQATDWRLMTLLALLAVGILSALAFMAPRITRRVKNARLRFEQSEEFAFRELRRSFRRHDAAASYDALLRWHDRLGSEMEPRQFVAAFGDHDLVRDLDALAAALYANRDERIDYEAFALRLLTARRAFLATSHSQAHGGIPSLNP
jgi:hypothetical protein